MNNKSNNSTKLNIETHVEPSQQRTYFTLPFNVPGEVERLTLKYTYVRRFEQANEIDAGYFISRPEANIIDLGLIGADGRQIGASGSDKSEIFISEVDSTPGYRRTRIDPGEWQIIIGAYKVAPEGVDVHYEVDFEFKHRRLLKGDLHTHTIASDGVHTLEELAWKARRNGLDFIAVTDHNRLISADELPEITGLTMIPGVEWTHFDGHANFTGADNPYDGPFAANTEGQIRAHFISAHERGALITINHPFDEVCPFKFNFQTFPFDCIEVWNGPMREANLRSVGLWHQLLASGKKIPMVAGSDYHRDTPFIFLGGPTMGVYALSAGASDILEAIQQGHAFATFSPNGPTLETTAGSAIMGDSVAWKDVKELQIKASGLLAGDVIRVLTSSSSDVIFKASTDGNATLNYLMATPGFARVEILRSFLPGLPALPALISNPIYFD